MSAASLTVLLPAGIPATESEKEGSLLRVLESATTDQDLTEALWQLACFYSTVDRYDLARQLLKILLELSDNPERKAFWYLGLGRLAEQERNYSAAADYYVAGLSLEPKEQSTAYFLRNNCGYCLNAQQRYAEAEQLLRDAIEIDSRPSNAYKNFGISRYGQGDILGAAWAWVEATKINPSDSRAFELLKKAAANHPNLLKEQPWILMELRSVSMIQNSKDSGRHKRET